MMLNAQPYIEVVGEAQMDISDPRGSAYSTRYHFDGYYDARYEWH